MPLLVEMIAAAILRGKTTIPGDIRADYEEHILKEWKSLRAVKEF